MSGKREHDPEDDMAKLLDLAAEQEALEMRAAEALSDAPGTKFVEPALRAAWGETAGRAGAAPRSPAEATAVPAERRGARPMWILGALAVAAAVLLFLWLRPRDGATSPGPRGEYLNTGDVRIDEPKETVKEWKRVRWTGPPGTYRVTVVDLETRDDSFQVTVTGEDHIELPASEIAKWKGGIEIRLARRENDGDWTRVAVQKSARTP